MKDRPIGLIILVGSAVLLLIGHGFFKMANLWNYVRLVGIMRIKYGYDWYFPLDEGPVINQLYPPLSYLAYAPSLLADSPVQAYAIGYSVGMAFFIVPAFIFFKGVVFKGELRPTLEATFLFTALVVFLGDFKHIIHADAPSLGLGLLSIIFLLRAARSDEGIKWITLSALSAVAAICAKHVMLVLIPGLVLIATFSLSKRSVKKLILLILIFSVGVLFLLHLAYGLPTLYLNLVKIPAGHSWTNILPKSFNVIRCLFIWLPLLLLAIHLVSPLDLRKRREVVEWLRHNQWCHPAIIGIINMPAICVGYFKAGGDTNNFALATYFLAASVVSALVLRWGRLNKPRWLYGLVYVLMIALISHRAVEPIYQRLVKHQYKPRDQLVFEFLSRKKDLTIYFPNYPLGTLMATGKLYHLQRGILEYDRGRPNMIAGHIDKHLPQQMRAICYMGKSKKRKGYPFNVYTQRVAIDRLERWNCYSRKE